MKKEDLKAKLGVSNVKFKIVLEETHDFVDSSEVGGKYLTRTDVYEGDLLSAFKYSISGDQIVLEPCSSPRSVKIKNKEIGEYLDGTTKEVKRSPRFIE